MPESTGQLIPGDPERRAEEERSKKGVPLVMPVVEELRDIAKRTGVPFN
jgi:L-2-hydroxycarboxylate dehydrogenase (NAD+)